MEEAIKKDEIIGSLTKQVKKLEDKCEDQANRSMRNTLVFKGVNGNEPNWTKTTEVLAGVISAVENDITLTEINSWIDRAHRMQSNENNNTKPRNIVAIMTSWKVCERIK